MGTKERGHRIFAALYDSVMAPVERGVLGPRRAALLGDLTGQVLDLGAGTGVNVPYFRRADRVTAAEPDPAMRARLAARVPGAAVPVEVAADAAESLGYADASFDAVACTLVLCTVPDLSRSLAEIRRVLRPGGTLVVLEHVRGSGRLAGWQDRVTPLWSALAAGCQPNRDIAAAIKSAGFAIENAESFDPFPRWVPARPLLMAVASVPGQLRPPRG